ncbi:MAG TPA: TolC family protein [Opitutus sp.]|nr:TolC family protein [Opitutus sp.]
MSSFHPITRPLQFAVLALAALLAPAIHGQAVLTLDDAVRLALERNPQIKVEAFGRSIARAELLTAYGRFDPALTFRRSYSEFSSLAPSNVIIADLIQTDDYSLNLEGMTPWGMSYRIGGTAQNQRYPYNGYANNFQTFGGISVTQPLLRGFGFGSNLLGVRIARADRGIANWQFQQTAIEVVTNVVIAYSDVTFAQQLLRIAQRSRDLNAGLLRENEKRFSVGDISESDVTQARARTATREESILVARQAVRDSVNRLRQLIGESAFPVDPEALVIEPADNVLDFPVNPADDLKVALDIRPDYQAARLGLVKLRAAESSARNQLLPQVDFVGSYGYSGLDPNFAASRRMVSNHENRSYSAGVVVSIPLTFAEGRGRSRSAKLRRRQFEADLIQLEQEIAVRIASAAGQVETTRERVAANRTAFDLARQALEGELKKLRAGTTTTFFVLNEQEQLIQSENALNNAMADERRAQAVYEREVGRTLKAHNITLDGE